MYKLCSENKGTDQLCSYCLVDLCLSFRICKNRVVGESTELERGT